MKKALSYKEIDHFLTLNPLEPFPLIDLNSL